MTATRDDRPALRARRPVRPHATLPGPTPPGPTPSGPTLRGWPAGTTNEEQVRGLRFTVVPHTHWDREWYMPFQQFRMRLARAVDRIVETLEADPEFGNFTLDGQAVILEDYAELRPDGVERLTALVAGGRIAVGPAYVLPDEFLSGQEALVRNMLVGRAVCRRFGAQPMPVAYMPDTFGHVAQLPQILAGFGLDAFVFWRGLGNEAATLGAVFEWHGPDGTPVVAIRQLGSYGSGDEIGRWAAGGTSVHDEPERWPEVAAQRFVRQLDTWGEQARLTGIPELLLCNGSDHAEIQADLPSMLSAARRRHPGMRADIGTYASYVERIRPHLGSKRLPVHRGELLGSREVAVLRGINSTRMYLKQQAATVERDLLVAETMASLALLGRRAPYPRAELRLAWRELLRNLPHDSISGCSVDEVHADMAGRFAAAAQIADRVTREGLAALAGVPERWSHRPWPAAERSVVNPLPWRRRDVVELPLVPAELARARSLVADTDAGPLPVQLVGPRDGRRVMLAVELDGFEGRTVRLRRGRADAAEPARAVDGRTIENEELRVEALERGGLRVTERRTGRVRDGLLIFEDVADRGDEYDFCPLDGDTGWSSLGVPVRSRVTARGPLVAELELSLVALLPRRLRADRRARTQATVAVPITTRIRLDAGADTIRFTTTVDNRAEDHRLRVRFASPDAPGRVRAEGHFAVIERPARPVWSGRDWAQPPADTSHTCGAVAAGDVVLLGHGLPEYEAVPRPDGGVDLALTLLRCVGWLSRDDLATRPGHAGPELATPGAQCRGRHVFEYALWFGEADDAELLRRSANERTPFLAGAPGADGRNIVSIGGDPVGFAALKGAEDGEGVVLRVFNPGAAAARISVHAPTAGAVACRLDEQPSEERRHPSGVLGGYEILSVRLSGPSEP